MSKQAAVGHFLFPFLRLFIILVCVLTLLFFLQRLTGDPVTVLVGHGATPEMIDDIRASMGLDRPLIEQYAVFMRKAAVLDFGESIRSQQSALDMVIDRFPATLLLSMTAISIAITVGIPLGIYAAIYHRRYDGKLINWFAGILQSTPNYWLGLILLLIFSVNLHWVGSVASLEDNVFKRLALPSITLSSFYLARLIRLVRSGLMDEMSQPYVLTARAKGLTSRTVFFVHIFRNTLIPIVTFIALDLSLLIGGSVVVETMFSYGGIGDQMIKAILNRDYPLVQATVLVIAVVVIMVNSFSVYVARIVDPRLAM